MKTNLLKAILVFVLVAALTACGHFRNDPKTSVWAGGMWAAPLIFAIGTVAFGITTYRSWKSGSVRQRGVNESSATPWIPVEGNTSIWKSLWIYGTIVCAAALVLTIWYVNSPYWK
jgi:hypothetical protein